MALQLIPHQSTALQRLSIDPHGRDLVHLPTGAGKTIILMQLSHDYIQQKKRVLILVHRDHLVRQVIDRFNEFYPEDELGIVQGKRRDWDSKIVVATVQTARRDVNVMPVDFDLVITDECHLCVAASYFMVYKRLGLINMAVFEELKKQAGLERERAEEAAAVREEANKKIEARGLHEDDLAYYNLMKDADEKARALESKNKMSARQRTGVRRLAAAADKILTDPKPRKHVGLTATPRRTDKIGLASIFSGIAYYCKMSDLVNDNRLCRVDILPVPLYDEEGKKLYKTALRRVLKSGLADNEIINLWSEHSDERDSTIAFCTNIEHAEQLAESFRNRGIMAHAIHSKLHKTERIKIESAFRDKEFPILTNVNVFIEGLDVPYLNRIIMARDTDSATLAVQAIGRGARLFEGKERCLVFDIGETIDRKVLADSVDMLRIIEYGDAEPKKQVKKKDKAPKKQEEHQKASFSVIRARAIFNHIERISASNEIWAWIPDLSVSGMFLEIGDDKKIRIGKQKDGMFAASYDTPLGRTLICRDKRTIAECKDLCIRYMLDYNLANHSYARRDASWRKKEVSQKQRKWLNARGIEILEGWNQGMASDMIGAYMQSYLK